jgi:hypothetical protein
MDYTKCIIWNVSCLNSNDLTVDPNLQTIDLDALKRMHESAAFKLQTALLNGSSWDEVEEQRKLLFALAVAIHKKQPTYFLHPAESYSRNRSGG